MEELRPWFALRSVPGIGNHLFKRLLERFKTPQNVFKASFDELTQVKGVSGRIAASVVSFKLPDSVKKELDNLRNTNYRIITMSDGEYPFPLLQIPDPPPFLYVYGDLPDITRSVAVVGSRKASRYGVFTAKKLSEDLAAQGFVVVSGMARGIDTAAHIGAVEGGGKTIAVLGSGLERIYPWENRRLFHKIAVNGAVVTEFSLHTAPLAPNFPIRNRIISGLTLGVVVVEAAERSGSLITARLAAEQGREVFAVPGSVHTDKSIGAHNLIKQGAGLVETAEDIIEELKFMIDDGGSFAENRKAAKPSREPAPKIELTAEESMIYDQLSPSPVHIDDLVRKTSMEPGVLSGILLNLELKGIVHQAPGKLFSII